MDINKSTAISVDDILNNMSIEDQQRYLFNLEFAIALKKRRMELGWTQDLLAEKSGINRMTINKIEKLNRFASLELVLKLLYTLDLKICFVVK